MQAFSSFNKGFKYTLAKEEPKNKLTKIVSSTKKAYESFNVDIINSKDPQLQLHKSK